MSPEIHEMIHDLEPSKLRQIVFKIQEALNEAHVGLDWFQDIVQEAMEAQKSEAANLETSNFLSVINRNERQPAVINCDPDISLERLKPFNYFRF